MRQNQSPDENRHHNGRHNNSRRNRLPVSLNFRRPENRRESIYIGNYTSREIRNNIEKKCVEFSSERPVRCLYSFQTKERRNLSSHSKITIEKTALRRDSYDLLADYESVVFELKDSEYQKRLWKNYQNENNYAKGIQFNDVYETVKKIGDLLKSL